MSIRSEIVEALDPVFEQRVAADVTPPGGLERPYARVIDNLSEPTVVRGDGRRLASRRMGQVNVVQDWDEESDSWVDEAVAAIDGLRLQSDGLRVLVQGVVRTADPDRQLVTHALTWVAARVGQSA